MSSMPPQPRYRQLAQTLINDIESGRYPLGELIPTEMELCEQFGASRFTVREAIKQLVEMGLVSRQAGVGTKVLSAAALPGYRQVMQGMTDLQQYTADTELDIKDAKMVVVSGALCRQLGAKSGESWLRLDCLRRVKARKAPPICVVEIYIHPAFRTVHHIGGRSAVPVYLRIEEQFGEKIVEIQQQIRSVALSDSLAAKLHAKPGSPALLITRTYYNSRREIIEVAASTHPADRFSYSQTFRHEWRGAGAAGEDNGV
jgi:DNA-binding GntR family transcriptional regulator